MSGVRAVGRVGEEMTRRMRKTQREVMSGIAHKERITLIQLENIRSRLIERSLVVRIEKFDRSESMCRWQSQMLTRAIKLLSGENHLVGEYEAWKAELEMGPPK